ncbi:ribosome small subunit-dependent GTPase A [Nodosilinea sp. LEGE 06152]|uniref:ribosome small subunit-dependent GTPase A n=1 Tax=Nodosilinea sp. LEGE 06152 TaxID=2777966 RepID=UPI0018822A77|nr:ribosome small subunit-dependent GTPase A [Nodosilinea sp. LEGE 06152]MBE9159083.1 ribosome small subunit-dependent GTPase A [Nodosilinea sp. LEGE 06152]
MNLTELGGWNTTCDRVFAPWAEAGFEAGRVALEHRGAYRLLTPTGELAAEVAGQFRHQAEDSQTFPAVGDWVVVQRQDNAHATIHAVLPRQSEFVRKAAGGKTEGQVVAANVDTVFLVCGLDGDFNLRRIERYLVAAWESRAMPVIVLNKADTCADLGARLVQVESVAIGVPIHAVSAATGAGLEQLTPYLGLGQTVALIGSSGVGKSTLTNHFLGVQYQTTQAVRDDDSRGRHTTTGRHLLPLPSGALLIDTPGMRELQLWTTSEGLEATFADIEALAADCRFRDCRHQGEPGCAVEEAIAAGNLDGDRLHSYHKLQREQQWLDQRHDARAALNSKRRWKTIHKAMRDRPKR